jgi:phage gpG-like protein
MANPFDRAFSNLQKKLDKVLDDSTRIAAALAVRHFRDNFNKQGFDDNGIQRWAPFKSPNYRPGQSKLVKTSQLRDSIKSQILGRGQIVIYTDRPYAAYHNNGTTKIPQRKFIGPSRSLNKLIKTEIMNRIRLAR